MTPLWGAVVVVAALAVSAGLGWVAAAGVLVLADRTGGGRRRAPRGSRRRPRAADDQPARSADDGPDGDRARAKLRGGTWIGVLERLAVTGTLLAGEPGGVAVVVAIKGLGRYPELRTGDDPAVSERFVIGTLASLVWAAGLGVLGRWLLTR
ncbi:hypothetical protein [Cellulomonas hominis]|uniref:hypothetical protein n=1 Tax=Cellulomonas hominis TaxID=156981 RepID=UPI001B9E065E|nr:hypothetical protein [Cellulomonas hominis]VTR75596.1 hypothetical protein CHMI_00347 [Cellulomonas hominis]